MLLVNLGERDEMFIVLKNETLLLYADVNRLGFFQLNLTIAVPQNREKDLTLHAFKALFYDSRACFMDFSTK